MNKISQVLPNSIGKELDIEKGDVLISINGEKINDIIDYKYLVSDDYIEVEIQKPGGEVWDLEIEKDYDEDLGLVFENSIIDEAKSCSNKCIFCFIDQLPKGLRETLYFKDDDSRLSFLQGNFVTLTNMKDEDIERIIKYRISPINVSVQTTNPELRIKMLNNRFAGNIYERLKRLSNAGIKMNCQIVLCSGINDGKELVKTSEDLFKLYPSIENVAVVPVGLTKFREGLFDLRLYDKKSALEQIHIVKELQKKYTEKIQSPFIRLSDEFYIVSGTEIPPEEHYGEYEQLEDGIGMTRLFRENIRSSAKFIASEASASVTIITGTLACEEIKKAAELIHEKNNNVNINVIGIINKFFGETITVAGLITAADIIDQTSGITLGDYVIIPDNMLRRDYELKTSDEKVFLDNVTVEELQAKLNTKIIACNFTGDNLIDIINNMKN